LRVRISSVLSFKDLVGQCGVVMLDTSSGPELVLARVQRANWFGDPFIVIGWAVIDMPMEGNMGGIRRPQSANGSIADSVDVAGASFDGEQDLLAGDWASSSMDAHPRNGNGT